MVVWLMGCIGCLLAMPLTTTAPYQAGLPSLPHGIFILHRLSAGPRRGGAEIPPPGGVLSPHGLTTLEGGAGDPTGIVSQIMKIKSTG